MNSPVCKDKDECNDQDGHKENLLESTEELRDHLPHVGDKDEDTEGTEAAEDHQGVGDGVGFDTLRHPQKPGKIDHKDGSIQDPTHVTQERLGGEDEAFGQDFDHDLQRHRNDKEVV